MKQRVYIRIGKNRRGRNKIAINKRPKYGALTSGSEPTKYLPTIQICLDLEIPDSEFNMSRILLEAKIEETKPCVGIKQVKEDVK